MGKRRTQGAETRILVVEDEARIRNFLCRALANCGYDVSSASDGSAALELLEREAYDLVLLDLLLPGVDGFYVLRRLAEIRPSQEVLVLSALSDIESKVRCFELGAGDYVTKPFSFAELVARVRKRVRESRERRARRYLDCGPLRLDLQERAAFVRGRKVELSTREFVLLAYLIRKGNEVSTREELLQSVWGYTFDPGTNVVDVYVCRLRRKVGEDLIETIRNAGYCCASAVGERENGRPPKPPPVATLPSGNRAKDAKKPAARGRKRKASANRAA